MLHPCLAALVTGLVIAVGQPVLNPTTTTTTSTTTTTTEAPIPDAIELSGTTKENYWKDYQLLGLYNLEGYRNGAPYYKRGRNAFLLGPIYFYYHPYENLETDSPLGTWIVCDQKPFDDNNGRGWLWKESPG